MRENAGARATVQVRRETLFRRAGKSAAGYKGRTAGKGPSWKHSGRQPVLRANSVL